MSRLLAIHAHINQSWRASLLSVSSFLKRETVFCFTMPNETSKFGHALSICLQLFEAYKNYCNPNLKECAAKIKIKNYNVTLTYSLPMSGAFRVSRFRVSPPPIQDIFDILFGTLSECNWTQSSIAPAFYFYLLHHPILLYALSDMLSHLPTHYILKWQKESDLCSSLNLELWYDCCLLFAVINTVTRNRATPTISKKVNISVFRSLTVKHVF